MGNCLPKWRVGRRGKKGCIGIIQSLMSRHSPQTSLEPLFRVGPMEAMLLLRLHLYSFPLFSFQSHASYSHRPNWTGIQLAGVQGSMVADLCRWQPKGENRRTYLPPQSSSLSLSCSWASLFLRFFHVMYSRKYPNLKAFWTITISNSRTMSVMSGTLTRITYGSLTGNILGYFISSYIVYANP